MATVDRVLPWRRHNDTVNTELAPLLSAYRRRHPKARVDTISRAYHMAADGHRSQRRASGESYINHPLAVASIVAEMGLDEVSVVAALLHDAVEDTEITVADVRDQFGDEVAHIVDGVTKLERLQFSSREEQQAATMRKMMIAMAKDLRVLLIKLADRLHNMRTIAGMNREKQQRIAHETLDIYAPLAHRLGIQEVKEQLEDLSFASLQPKKYAELDHLVATRTPERDLYLAQAIAEVHTCLRELGIHAEVTGRGKHLWSIYEKMVVKGRPFDEIFDIVAVRVIVDSVKDCYAAVGSIHGRWSPVAGRFKDYIAMPKFNMYQSLHTTVIGPGGRSIEVQIRTRDMHERAEWGVAAHWAYKDEGRGGKARSNEVEWLRRLVDLHEEVSDPDQFMKNLKTDLEQDEIFIFTPKGRVITLPTGSTPVDFAYAVHTEVGHRCIGSKVNGRLMSLDQKLTNGDTCEIFTSKVEGAGPSQDWLQFVVSHRAQNKIRQWFSRERRIDAIESGREELNDEFRREGLPVQKIWNTDEFKSVMEELGYTEVETLAAAIGEHHVSARGVAQKVAKAVRGESPAEVAHVIAPHRARARAEGTVGVHVEGMNDVLVRLANCCTPVPGDAIIGFVTRGRGVSVHREDCANAVSLGTDQSARLIDVDWEDHRGRGLVVAGIEVVALDRSRLLLDVANALSDQHVNIIGCETVTSDDQTARMRFQIEMSHPSQLNTVLSAVKRIDSVYDVHRLIAGGQRAD